MEKHVTSTVPTVEEQSPAASSTELPITTEKWQDCPPQGIPEISSTSNWKQRADVKELLLDYYKSLSDAPACTFTIQEDIVITTNRIQAKLYPIAFHLKPYFEEKVDCLIKQSLIRFSSSSHSSPVVMVCKSDVFFRVLLIIRI